MFLLSRSSRVYDLIYTIADDVSVVWCFFLDTTFVVRSVCAQAFVGL
jgi:hypothetical protein